ncbi:TPA: hypothetical protein ACIFDD_001947 [Acinetobacter baumannii]
MVNKKITIDLMFLLFAFFTAFLILRINGGLPERVIYYGFPSFILMYLILKLEYKKFFLNKDNIFSKVLLKLGDSSYSLYLSHSFVLGAGVIILNKIHLINNNTVQVLIIILSIGAVIWGWISYKFIEKPLINFFIQKDFYKLFLKSKKQNLTQ